MGEQQTKPCECGKNMILRGTGRVLTTYPPQYPMDWFCAGCGARTVGPVIRGKTDEEVAIEDWERANPLIAVEKPL